MKTKKYIIKILIFLTIICLFKHQNVYAALVHDDLPLKKVAEFSRDSYYMQGFTITNKYLIFGAIDSTATPNTKVYVYDKDTYKLVTSIGTNPITSLSLDHANDFTYNSKTNEVIAFSSVNNMSFLNPNTLAKVKDVASPVAYYAVAYDATRDQYAFQYGGSKTKTRTVSIYNSDFTKHIKDITVKCDATGQGMEYYNGYLYVVNYEQGADNSNATYTSGLAANSVIIYVYDVNDGSLVKTYANTTGIGEVEGIAFNGNKMILNFDTNVGSTYYYSFYTPTYSSNSSFTPTVNVTLDGASAPDNVFTFELRDSTGKVLETKSSTTGKVTFSKINYTSEGTTKYSIVQTTANSKEYKVDSNPINLTAKAVYNPATNTVEVNASYSASNTFANTTNNLKVSFTPKVELKFSNSTSKAPDGTFTFALYDSTDKLISTTKNSADSIAFKDLTFTKEGTYNYKIVQTTTNSTNYKVDNTPITMTIKVTYNSEQNRYDSDITYSKKVITNTVVQSSNTSITNNQVSNVPNTASSISVITFIIATILLVSGSAVIISTKNNN